jgi:phosphohistidine swiveling domain-containing protein
MSPWSLEPLAVALRDARGGKARGLAALAAADLPVPDAVLARPPAAPRTVDDILALPPDQALLDAMRARFGDARLAIRSAMAVEAGAARSAAGIFASVVAVPPAGWWSAILEVWASAYRPLVGAYLGAGAAVGPGLVLQRFVDGARAVAAVAPAVDGALRLELGGQPLDADAAPALAELARRAAASIADHAPDGAEVELIAGVDGTAWVVQARPLPPRAAPALAAVAPPAALLAPLRESGRRWRLDVEHNPAPLSPAQAVLVALADGTGAGTASMITVAGYLYTAARLDVARPRVPDDGAALRAQVVTLEHALAQLLGEGEAHPAPSLALALAAYRAAYVVWAGQLSPLARGARDELVRRHGAAAAGALLATRPRALTSLLAAWAAAPSTEPPPWPLAASSAVWDVAWPTYGEQPALLAALRDDTRTRIASARPAAPASDPYAAVVADLLELDDHWFARMQALVRRALVARARARGLADADAGWVAPAQLDDAHASHATLAAHASAARRAHARAAAWRMPLEVGGDAVEATPAATPSADVWTGLGIGDLPPTRGVVVRLDRGAALVPPAGAVVVAELISPALAVLAGGASAIVSASGGALDHGAALARERHVPAVVACPGAAAALRSGDLVEVDARAGRVRRLQAAQAAGD